MNTMTASLCEHFIHNRDTVKTVFTWGSGLEHAAAAMIMTLRGVDADADKLLYCKNSIKETFGVFSSFRGTVLPFAAATLASTDAPDDILRCASSIYKALRSEFYSSDYLPLAAMTIALTAEPYDHGRIINRTCELYKLIRSEHPFLTSGEDALLSALLALASRSSYDLISDMEACYETLKPQFFARNSLQSLSHILALSTVAPAEKCERVMAFYNAFYSHGRRYGSDNGLAALGALSMTGVAPDTAATEIIKIDEWMSEQRGFGFFSSVTKRHRLLFSTALYTYARLHCDGDGDGDDDDRAITEMMSAAVIFAILSAIIAQQQAANSAT